MITINSREELNKCCDNHFDKNPIMTKGKKNWCNGCPLETLCKPLEVEDSGKWFDKVWETILRENRKKKLGKLLS